MHNCAYSLMEAALLTGESLPLTSEEQWFLERMLYDDYFAFEAMTAQKWHGGICGICETAPVFEIGDGKCKKLHPSNERTGVFLVPFCFVLFFAIN